MATNHYIHVFHSNYNTKTRSCLCGSRVSLVEIQASAKAGATSTITHTPSPPPLRPSNNFKITIKMSSKDLDIHAAFVIVERVIKKKINHQSIGPFQEDWRNLPEIRKTLCRLFRRTCSSILTIIKADTDEILPPNSANIESSEYWNDYQMETTYNGPVREPRLYHKRAHTMHAINIIPMYWYLWDLY